MPNEPHQNDIREVWQSQEVEEMKFPTEEIMKKAELFRTRITRRNLREYLACALVVIAFTYFAVVTHVLIARVAFGLIIAGTFYVAWELLTRGATYGIPENMGRANCLQFYRGELEKQRDLLRDIWSWYLGPFIPGMALLTLWGIYAAPPSRRWFPIAYAVVVVAGFWSIAAVNKRGARKLDEQIRSLREVEQDTA